jgi:hypothetical protein
MSYGGAFAQQHALRERNPLPVVLLVLSAFVLSCFARNYALSTRRSDASAAAGTGSGTLSIGRFDSYALALVLGGLRGPLVMVLWTTSEAQKSDRNLEDFDTKVEWIRLLQPEFDSVHIFQVWNKAYNVSVQMAAQANKYTTILDAVDYAEKVDEERPNNVNILVSLAQVWFDKLGNSNEKGYYRARVRAESLPHGSKSRLKRDDPGFRRTDLDPLLMNSGGQMVLVPAVLQPTVNPPVMSKDGEAYDGSKLQFLKQFEPYPEGLSPLAIGYNYYKRAQVLQAAGKQKHLQLSEMVIDSRPALSLKTWAEEEWDRGRRSELAAFGLTIPNDRLKLEMPSAELSDPKIADAGRLASAIFNYERIVTLVDASLKEYDRHLKAYPQSVGTYRSHQDLLESMREGCLADRDYLDMLRTTDPAKKKQLADSAIQHYIHARDLFAIQALRYYTDDDVLAQVLPKGVTKYDVKIDPAKPGQVTAMAFTADQLTKQRGKEFFDNYSDDRTEYLLYATRCTARLNALGVTDKGG